MLQKKEKNLGVPVEVQPLVVKKRIEELKRAIALFTQLDKEISYERRNAKRDLNAFYFTSVFEQERSEQGGTESFKAAYRMAFKRMEDEWLRTGKIPSQPTIAKEVLDRVDFTTVSVDSFFAYLYFADKQRFEKLISMYLDARKAWLSFEQSVYKENLLEHFGTDDSYRSAQSRSFVFLQAFGSAREFVDSIERPSMPKSGEPPASISEETGPRIKYRLAPRPAIGHELLAAPSERLRYFDPSTGVFLDKGSIEAMKRSSTPASLSDTLKLLPLVGPIMDIKKKIDEISTKGKLPTVRTWDPIEKRYVDGKLRVVQAYEIRTWNPVLEEFTITYLEKKTGEKSPIPPKVFDPVKKKTIEGKVTLVNGLEIESWNPFTKEFEKRITERPKPGALDYGELVVYLAMAALDGIFITQTIGRTAARGTGAKAFIRKSDQELYISALENLDRSESVRLLNIAREKKSWGRVARDLRKLAQGGEVTAEIMKGYIEKEWGKGIGKRIARRAAAGVSDFFGNSLTPLSRRRFQSRMVAEFFNEMRHTTDFKTAGEIMKSLRTAGLSPAHERLATRAVFSTMTSFSRKTQRLFLAEVSKPGGWQNLMRAIEKEGLETGISRIVPYYSRAKSYGPNFRALEFVAYGLVVPAASKKPMEALGKHLENKMQIKAQEIEDMKILFELTDRANQIFPRRPGAE